MHQEGNNNEYFHGMEANGSDPLPDNIQQDPHTQMMDRPTGSLVHPIHFPQLPGSLSLSNQPTLLQRITSDRIQNQQLKLHQNLSEFWKKQMEEVKAASNFKKLNLPIVKIKKLMLADKDVCRVAGETPVVFAKACEMFITDLTIRAWNITEDDHGKILRKGHIFSAIDKTSIFDFATSIKGPDYVPHESVGSFLRKIVVSQHVNQGLRIQEQLEQHQHQHQNQVDHGLFMQQQHQEFQLHQPMDQMVYLQQIEQHLEQDENEKEVEVDELQRMQLELENELQQSSKGS